MTSAAIASRIPLIDRLRAFCERHGSSGAFCTVSDVVLHKLFHTSIHTVVWLDLKADEMMACAAEQFTFRCLTADEVE
jgi:hypothetical protein